MNIYIVNMPLVHISSLYEVKLVYLLYSTWVNWFLPTFLQTESQNTRFILAQELSINLSTLTLSHSFRRKAQLLCGPVTSMCTSSTLVNRELARMARRLFGEHILISSVADTSRPFFQVFACQLWIQSSIWPDGIFRLRCLKVLALLVWQTLSLRYGSSYELWVVHFVLKCLAL